MKAIIIFIVLVITMRVYTQTTTIDLLKSNSISKSMHKDYKKIEIGKYIIHLYPYPVNVVISDRELLNGSLYEYIFDNNRLYFFENELILNKHTYGFINETDLIEINNREVYINNILKKGKLLPIERRVELSKPESFSTEELGDYIVKVAPGCVLTSVLEETSEDSIFYKYAVGNITVMINNDTLFVNKANYGYLEQYSEIVIEEGVVYINGMLKNPN